MNVISNVFLLVHRSNQYLVLMMKHSWELKWQLVEVEGLE